MKKNVLIIGFGDIAKRISNKIKDNEIIDEGILIWFPAPNSYTGEDMAEIHIHGCLLYTSPSPRDNRVSRMPSSA